MTVSSLASSGQVPKFHVIHVKGAPAATLSFFFPSAEANAVLQQQLGEANTTLRGKEAECSKLAEERDRLTTQLAEQAELLKKAHKEAEEKETALLAEFASERSSWSDKEALLSSGFHEIEDIVDGESLYFLSSRC